MVMGVPLNSSACSSLYSYVDSLKIVQNIFRYTYLSIQHKKIYIPFPGYISRKRIGLYIWTSQTISITTGAISCHNTKAQRHSDEGSLSEMRGCEMCKRCIGQPARI